MKKLCSKNILLFFSLLGLVFLFVLPFQAKATEQISIDNSADGINDNRGATFGGYQTFTAVDNNFTGFQIYSASVDTNIMIDFNLCEVASNSSTSCIGANLMATTTVASIDTGYHWYKASTTAIATTVGHFYKAFWTSPNGVWTYHTTVNYGGGVADVNSGTDDYVFQVLYDDAFVPEPTISGVVTWAGVGTEFGQIGGYWNIPVYYNFCSSYNYISYAYLTIGASYTDGFTQVLADKTSFIGPQKCSGMAYITSHVRQTDPYTGNMGINLVMVPFDVVEPVDETTLPLATTTMPVNIDYTSSEYKNYLDPIMPNPLFLSTKSGTTTQTFAYDFTGLAWSGGEVCLFNSVSSFKTNYCTSTSDVIGTSSIQFPNVTAPYQFKGEYQLYSSTSIPIFKSEPFTVNWVVNYKPGQVQCDPPVLDLSHSCDKFDTSGSGFTLGNLACGLVQSVQTASFMLFVPSCDSMDTFHNSFNIFKRAFPFNAFFDLTDTIDSAIASSSASSTTSFGIPFIDQNSTSTNKFYIMPIISSTTASTTLGSANNSTFRLTVGFIFWILGAVSVYFTIRKI